MSKKVQRGSHNVAGDGDQVAVQVGQIKPASDRSGREQPAPAGGTSTNVRSDNATVGRQEDVIEGGLTIRR
ncbi:hypothetical protein [Plantactinospora sp. CA-290183]|uniref:hypothetical protein n=1 Tax=Plantactinospora sp. CA-290183 TaxID=3240006 RepID=UPI003D92665E